MTSRSAALLTLLALAGCAGDKGAPVPSGAWRALNAGQWDIDPALAPAPVMPKAPG
jgi:hypothetical protein